MEEKKNKSKKKQGNWTVIIILAFVAIGAVVAWLLYSFFSGSEQKISEPIEEGEVGLLYCRAEKPSSGFFEPAKTTRNMHEIKVIFNDGKAEKISYEYTGTSENEADAKYSSSRMHADYNIYMGENRLTIESLYPTFVADGTKVRANLYAEGETFTPVTAKLFFLNREEYDDFYNYSYKVLERVYENKGFSCDFED